jgi:hypothetical protein
VNLPVRAFHAGVEILTHRSRDFGEFGVVRIVLDGSLMRIALLLALTLTACAPGDEGVYGICLHCEDPSDDPGAVDPGKSPTITAPALGDESCPAAGCFIAPAGSAHYLVDHGTGGQVRVSTREPIVAIHAPAELVTLTALAPGDSVLIAESLNFDPVTKPFSVAETISDVRLTMPRYTTISRDLAFLPNAKVFVAIDAARGSDVRRAIDESLTGDGDQLEWDTFQLPNAPGPVALALTADSFGTRTFDLVLAYESDRIEARVTGSVVCFHSFLGARELVAAATMSMTPNPRITFTHHGANCVRLEGHGDAELHAAAAGHFLDVTITLP